MKHIRVTDNENPPTIVEFDLDESTGRVANFTYKEGRDTYKTKTGEYAVINLGTKNVTKDVDTFDEDGEQGASFEDLYDEYFDEIWAHLNYI